MFFATIVEVHGSFVPFAALGVYALVRLVQRPGDGLAVIAGLAIQAGNLAQKNPETGERVTASELYGFAVEPLRLDYIFWGIQEPYYTDEILPLLNGQ